MIIYKDKLTGDEVMSDVYDIKESTVPGLWEIDGKNIVIGSENFQLEGANPSAEEGGDDEGGDETSERKIDIVHQFRLNHMEAKPSKKAAGAELKKYLKGLSTHIKDKDGEEAMKEFQKVAPGALKKILADWDDYDVYAGESMSEEGMWVLINYREDGVTPFATIWKHGVDEMKV